MTPRSSELAGSNPIGIILTVVITFALAAVILLMAVQLPHYVRNEEVPVVFEIVTMKYTNDTGKFQYKCTLTVKNSGTISYDNRKLSAKTYRNGELLPCVIPYINFQEYLRHKPLGIQTIGGAGTNNYAWVPGATISIIYAKGTFRPGDTVRFEVYDRDTKKVLSRDTYPHAEEANETNQERMMKLYLSRQGA